MKIRALCFSIFLLSICACEKRQLIKEVEGEYAVLKVVTDLRTGDFDSSYTIIEVKKAGIGKIKLKNSDYSSYEFEIDTDGHFWRGSAEDRPKVSGHFYGDSIQVSGAAGPGLVIPLASYCGKRL